MSEVGITGEEWRKEMTERKDIYEWCEECVNPKVKYFICDACMRATLSRNKMLIDKPVSYLSKSQLQKVSEKNDDEEVTKKRDRYGEILKKMDELEELLNHYSSQLDA